MFLYEAESAFVKFTAKGKESQGKTEQLIFYGFRDQRSADTSRDQGRNRCDGLGFQGHPGFYRKLSAE